MDEDFSVDFLVFARDAERILAQSLMLPNDVWTLAQYLDLAHIGLDRRHKQLTRRIESCVRNHLALNGQRPAVQALCTRSPALAALRDELLEERTATVFAFERAAA